MIKYIYFLAWMIVMGCASSVSDTEEDEISLKVDQAAVTGVVVSGNEGAYSFNVEISSPDTGCEQYANWWEIIDEQGNLLYRRILSHSHVNEQPFVRSGGPVDIAENRFIYIRGHLNTNGYGTQVFAGTITNRLKEDFLEEDFAIELAESNPQPSECAF